MMFPDQITVTVKERNSSLIVPELAIVLILQAVSKNDYFVGPFISDENGEVTIKRRDCEAAISRAQEMFLMDYQGNLSTCRSQARLQLHDPVAIETMIRQYETLSSFWGRAFEDPDALMAALKKAKNSAFQPSSVVVLDEALMVKPAVTLLVDKRMPDGRSAV